MRFTTSPRLVLLRAVALAALLLLLPAATARATLTLDLRSTDSANPKLVYPPAGTGYVLHFDLYAVVTGHDADPTNDGVQEAFFSLLSTDTVAPGLKGDLTVVNFVAPFDNDLRNAGTRQDLDGDGDLDVGSNDSTQANGWIFAHSGAMRTGQSEYLLAHVTFTPTAPFLAGQTEAAVGLRVMANPLVIPALWQEDGHPMDVSSGGVYTTGAPVILAVPEPGTLALLLAPLALLHRSRRRRRC